MITRSSETSGYLYKKVTYIYIEKKMKNYKKNAKNQEKG